MGHASLPSMLRRWAAHVALVELTVCLRCLHARPLREALLGSCGFELIMVDNRPWKRVGASNMPYWVMATIVNYAYAARFAYSFRLVRPAMQSARDYPGWNKVLYLRDRLSDLSAEPACTWLLYLDADAFVREADLPLPTFLAGLAARYPVSADVGIILARESNLTGSGAAPPLAAFLNTGVLLLRSGPQSRRLLDAWLLAGRHVQQRRLWTTWPAEQGILSELLLPGSYPHGNSFEPC